MATVYAAPPPQQEMATYLAPSVVVPPGGAVYAAPQPQLMTFDHMLGGEGVMLKQLTNLCCGICCLQVSLRRVLVHVFVFRRP